MGVTTRVGLCAISFFYVIININVAINSINILKKGNVFSFKKKDAASIPNALVCHE